MTADPRGKHRIFDPDETTLLPATGPGADDTAPIAPPGAVPAQPVAGEAPTTVFAPVPTDTPTMIIPAVPPDPATTAGAASASVPPLEAQHTTVLPAIRDATPQTEEKKPPKRRWNERIVPLRPKRTADGYLSIHSELTRTTAGTIVRGTVRGAGELLITLGLIVLLFAAYEVWGVTAEINAHQNDMARQLEEQWNRGGGTDPTVGPGGAPATGAPVAPPAAAAKGIAILHLPKINKWWVVVEGITPKDIRRNPGHYPGTAMPGQQGNFSVAGHRNQGTFWDLDKVVAPDKIVVETEKTWFVYEVTHQRIVAPSAIEVVRPVPPGEAPGKLLTLTTCNPKLDNYQRLIVHAKFLRSQAKSAGRPAELGG